MKKYLMTGMAALAICAAFTSCSKETNVYNPEQPKQDIQLSYEQAFVKVFGQPAADQDWGFGTTRAFTRNNGAINVNGNMWTECPGVEIPGEVDAIYGYVAEGIELMTQHQKHFSTDHPENLNGYFVTQVRSGNNNYEDNTYPRPYYNQGTEDITNVGQYMNHLQIAFNENPSIADLNNATSENVSGWQHINNFNGSSNINWSNPESAEKGNTKVEDKGAYDFAYLNSLDSKYHKKWILVDGYYITEDHRFQNYYYVCFDFESDPGDSNKTRVSYEKKIGEENGEDKYQGGWNAELTGTYWTVEEITTKLTEIDGVPMNEIRNITINSYLQGDKMVAGDNVYSDWIVRITKGAPNEETPNYSIRVIGEDLTFGEDLDTDFDFNDVVFDVALNVPNKTYIKVKAAGGTLPIIIGVAQPDANNEYTDYEIHHILGVNNTGIMINTHADAAGYANRSATAEDGILVLNTTYTNAKDIPVFVKKNGAWVELKAQMGEPASKLGVDTDFQWCNERVSLKSDYPLFVDWVTTAGAERVKWY